MATTDMGRKLGGLCPLFWGGERVPIYHNVAWAKAYLHTTWHLDPSSRLATIDMRQKFVGAQREGCAPFYGGELGPHPAQCGLGRGLPTCQVAS